MELQEEFESHLPTHLYLQAKLVPTIKRFPIRLKLDIENKSITMDSTV